MFRARISTRTYQSSVRLLVSYLFVPHGIALAIVVFKKSVRHLPDRVLFTVKNDLFRAIGTTAAADSGP